MTLNVHQGAAETTVANDTLYRPAHSCIMASTGPTESAGANNVLNDNLWFLYPQKMNFGEPLSFHGSKY